MKYPANFSQDLRELSAFYDWNAEDKLEVKAAFSECEPTVRYLTTLAAAHRAGYRQYAGNNFQRLKDWCLDVGIGDPYGSDFDIETLDSIVVDPRIRA